MNKKIISSVLVGFTLSVTSVFAQNVSFPDTQMPSTVSPVIEFSDKVFSKNLTNLKARGFALIKGRVNAINKNAEIIANDKNLTTEQKALFATAFSAKITELNAVVPKLASTTDVASAKVVVQSIFTDFRIYAVFIPQMRLEKRIYDLQNKTVQLNSFFTKKQIEIDAEKALGKDVTVWQKNLDDAKTLVATDTAKLSVLLTQVVALKPSDYSELGKLSTSGLVIKNVSIGLQSIVKDFNGLKNKISKPAFLRYGNQKNYAESLAQSSWTWVSYATPDGVSTPAPLGDKFVLSFLKDKRISSTTDCNTLGASYTLEKRTNSLSFGPMMMTMMYCDGSQEGLYSALLAKTSSYKIEGNLLVLTNASGTMTFSKKN